MFVQILLMIFLIVFGLLPVVFLTGSIPVVIVWKIYRRIRYGIRITE